MMIASLNAQQLIMLARRKPSSITTSITRALELIDEDRRPTMTTLRGIKEKGRRLDLLCLSLVRALYSKQNNKKKKNLIIGMRFGTGVLGRILCLGFTFIIFLLFAVPEFHARRYASRGS